MFFVFISHRIVSLSTVTSNLGSLEFLILVPSQCVIFFLPTPSRCEVLSCCIVTVDIMSSFTFYEN